MKKSWTFMSMVLLVMIWGTIFISISSSVSDNFVYAQNNVVNEVIENQIVSAITETHNRWLWSSLKSWFVPTELSIKSDSFLNKTISNITETVKSSTENFVKTSLVLNHWGKEDFFSQECNPVEFSDINWHKYQSSIQNLATNCTVKWTINKDTFYPDNLVRRADVLTIFTKSYQSYFIDVQKWLTLTYFSDVKTWTKLFQIVQAANYMWIVELLIWKNKDTIWLDEFVSRSDIIRMMTLLHTVKPVISEQWLQILFNQKWYITRWELAYVVDVSLGRDGLVDRPNKVNNTKKDTDSLKEYPWVQSLVSMWVLNTQDFVVKNPEYAITRKQFLTLLVRTKATLNTSIPVSVPNMNYFADVNEWTGTSVLTQAKNLWLTAFFEEVVRWKIYLNPNKFVSQYEASVVINQIAKNTQEEDKTQDNVFVQNEKVAQMILVAFDLKQNYDFIEKTELWDVASMVKGWFWKAIK